LSVDDFAKNIYINVPILLSHFFIPTPVRL
jgi:hypothetical protein